MNTATTFHCKKCMQLLFLNEIIQYNRRENKIIISQLVAKNIEKRIHNIIICETCKVELGKYKSSNNTYIIKKDSVIRITIRIEEIER